MGMRSAAAAFLVLTAGATACSDSTGPGAASRLVFEVEPVPVGTGLGFAPVVVIGIEDDGSLLVPDWNEDGVVSLEGGAGDEALEGTWSEVPEDGLAAFPDLAVSAAW